MVLLAFAGGYALGVGSVVAAGYWLARWAMRRAVDPRQSKHRKIQ